jgi:tetratricopeptide (TPR) repeat protein
MPSANPERLLSLSKHWPYRTGYFAVLVFLWGIEASILVSTKASLGVSTAILFGTAAVLFIAWYFSRSIPKTKSNKVGFVISIACDDESEAKRIRADFVLTLQRLIKAGKTGSSFQFIEVPSFHSERVVDIDDAQKLRIQTKAHFLLYGRVRVRNLNNKEHHFIELDGVVAHKPIPDNISKQLANEFSELLPRKVAIATENDLLAFQFASEWAEVVAKYIIGIAAALSGDLVYAEHLYTEVLEKVKSNTHDFPVFEKLLQRLPTRIFELFEARATHCYEQWVVTHDQNEVENMGSMLNKIDFEQYKRPSIAFLESIFHFLKDGNVTAAQEWLNKCPKTSRNSAWHFNVAFLHAYQGDLKTAIRHYRAAVALPITPDLISKIEDFLVFIASSEPAKYQLFYCLGFFNWQVKGDNTQAVTDFEKFLHSGVSTEFSKERELARDWLSEIAKETADPQ